MDVGAFDLDEVHGVAFVEACTHGRLETARWLAELDDPNPVTIGQSFKWACVRGHLATVKWLAERGLDPDTFSVSAVFQGTCESGHLDTAKWLADWFGPMSPDTNGKALLGTCVYRHWDVVRWLLAADVDVKADLVRYGWAFYNTCKAGHLDLAKRLFDLGPELDPYNKNSSFRAACELGHLDTVQWLVNVVGADIHLGGDKVFRSEHEGVVRWLRGCAAAKP